MVVLQNVSPPKEGVRHEEVDITAVLDGKRLGLGTLCVAESRVSWIDGSGVGFSLDYPSISLHAISRDLSVYPAEHLYVQVNSKNKEDSKDEEVKAEEEADSSSDVGEDDDDDDVSTSAFTEIRFVPNEKASLEKMFVAMSECQALHPDPEDSDSDFDGDEYDVEEAEQGQIDLPTYYSFEEGMSQLTMEGQATLERLEGMQDQSSASQHCMAGVRTDDAAAALDDDSKTDSGALGVSGQFDDAEVDHWFLASSPVYLFQMCMQPMMPQLIEPVPNQLGRLCPRPADGTESLLFFSRQKPLKRSRNDLGVQAGDAE